MTNKPLTDQPIRPLSLPFLRLRVLTLIRAKRKEFERFVKFLVVGTIGFVVDTGTLNLLVLAFHYNTDTQRLIAKSISFSLAIISNFTWNHFWTYPDSRSKPMHHKLAQFSLVSVIGLGINLLIFGTLSGLLIARFGLAWGTNLAQACAVIVVLFWNFFANRFWTYSDVS